MAKYIFPSTPFSLMGGPQIGYLLSSKATSTYGASSSSTDEYHKGNLGIVLGAEYGFKNGYLISIRYVGGLTNIAKSYQGVDSLGNDVTVTPDAKTTGVSLTVGIEL